MYNIDYAKKALKYLSIDSVSQRYKVFALPSNVRVHNYSKLQKTLYEYLFLYIYIHIYLLVKV